MLVSVCFVPAPPMPSSYLQYTPTQLRPLSLRAPPENGASSTHRRFFQPRRHKRPSFPNIPIVVVQYTPDDPPLPPFTSQHPRPNTTSYLFFAAIYILPSILHPHPPSPQNQYHTPEKESPFFFFFLPHVADRRRYCTGTLGCIAHHNKTITKGKKRSPQSLVFFLSENRTFSVVFS